MQIKMFIRKFLKSILLRSGFSISRNPDFGMDSCLKRLAMRGFKPEMVLDIGAAWGDWTLLAMKYWPDSAYFLVEPLHEWKNDLEKLSARYSNVKYILAGVGAAPGRLQLSVTEDLYGSSLFSDVLAEETREVRMSQIPLVPCLVRA